MRLLLTASILLVGCNSDRIANLEKENRELSAKVNAAPKNASLALQAQCAQQAERMFKNEGWNKKEFAVFENHYNVTLNRCFIKIENSEVSGGMPTQSKTLLDAFEGKVYGDYMWINSKKQKYWDVKPMTCKVTNGSGEEKTCASDTEFDELAKAYMEN